MAKKRIDVVLVERGFFETREKARRAVMAGVVFLGTERVAKPSQTVAEGREEAIVVKARDHAVSRAYYKLKKAFDLFGVDAADRIAIDVGSSTGGFSQLLLERGCRKVYAVDCGTNQLHYSLRSDPRIEVMEKTNARFLEAERFAAAPPDLAVMDVSFISSTLLLPVIVKTLGVRDVVVLVKPQFEAGRGEVGDGGIVRDPAVQAGVIGRVADCLSGLGLVATGLTFSPVTGGDGNIEFLLRACGPERCGTSGAGAGDIAGVVAAAHVHFDPQREDTDANPDHGRL